MFRPSEKTFTKWMKSKKKSSFLKGMALTEGQRLMYRTGKNLKGSKLKKFKTDMLGLESKKYINKHL
jgi:hypothetical protein|tara:strand:+ start:914 stop:1114 length:201 start_codon:yes stop_codon:yes gene_type:complete